MSQVVGLPSNSYKPITNTAWVRARLCKLRKGCTRLASASHKVYQLLAHGRWISPGTLVSSTTKTGRHDKAEILLKVALSTKNQINSIIICFISTLYIKLMSLVELNIVLVYFLVPLLLLCIRIAPLLKQCVLYLRLIYCGAIYGFPLFPWSKVQNSNKGISHTIDLQLYFKKMSCHISLHHIVCFVF